MCHSSIRSRDPSYFRDNLSHNPKFTAGRGSTDPSPKKTSYIIRLVLDVVSSNSFQFQFQFLLFVTASRLAVLRRFTTGRVHSAMSSLWFWPWPHYRSLSVDLCWPWIRLLQTPCMYIIRGCATVLKVGGQIMRAKRAEKNFWPPLFGHWRDKILLR